MKNSKQQKLSPGEFSVVMSSGNQKKSFESNNDVSCIPLDQALESVFCESVDKHDSENFDNFNNFIQTDVLVQQDSDNFPEPQRSIFSPISSEDEQMETVPTDINPKSSVSHHASSSHIATSPPQSQSSYNPETNSVNSIQAKRISELKYSELIIEAMAIHAETAEEEKRKNDRVNDLLKKQQNQLEENERILKAWKQELTEDRRRLEEEEKVFRKRI